MEREIASLQVKHASLKDKVNSLTQESNELDNVYNEKRLVKLLDDNIYVKKEVSKLKESFSKFAKSKDKLDMIVNSQRP